MWILFLFLQSEVVGFLLKFMFLLGSQLVRLASVKNITKYYLKLKLKNET